MLNEREKALLRKLGRMGGQARAKKLSPLRRRQIAVIASAAAKRARKAAK